MLPLFYKWACIKFLSESQFPSFSSPFFHRRWSSRWHEGRANQFILGGELSASPFYGGGWYGKQHPGDSSSKYGRSFGFVSVHKSPIWVGGKVMGCELRANFEDEWFEEWSWGTLLRKKQRSSKKFPDYDTLILVSVSGSTVYGLRGEGKECKVTLPRNSQIRLNLCSDLSRQ